ncbi:hypothetical protein [Lichenicoccus sp.]|uniref:hypothetical protein n=1 Tax=Lichenicoccus sp. TaxID=2781899 RepID=UPI003D0D84D7
MADPPEPNPPCKTTANDTSPAEARALRAAAALRENLRKRKQQSRARAESPGIQRAGDASQCR